ncbi:hypothetical protein HYPSUDRAFT_209149 [Hypholoma sublateritium FD-334 SS-4]|uniref:Uncharacterized protein n=1 Tax=Hypholoma sublateritium (strain FD-334 SS-4) TaxID=945553 RepID=A0A0D2NZQ6_HYPSF|nr:hypothetical protein HYPSUDRAFT_209149 [Hypholoma sublateritium FD-334 SS-4]
MHAARRPLTYLPTRVTLQAPPALLGSAGTSLARPAPLRACVRACCLRGSAGAQAFIRATSTNAPHNYAQTPIRARRRPLHKRPAGARTSPQHSMTNPQAVAVPPSPCPIPPFPFRHLAYSQPPTYHPPTSPIPGAQI